MKENIKTQHSSVGSGEEMGHQKTHVCTGSYGVLNFTFSATGPMAAAISPTHMATAAWGCLYLNEHIQYM